MRLWDALFGCRHERYTWPLTVRGEASRPAGRVTGTYVCCLQCGAELPYDFKRMRILRSERQKRRYLGVATTALLLVLMGCEALPKSHNWMWVEQCDPGNFFVASSGDMYVCVPADAEWKLAAVECPNGKVCI